MVDFKNKALIKLGHIPNERGKEIVKDIIIKNEEIIASFESMRDKLIFTDKRIISVNVQGLTGKKIDYTSIPYSKIQAYSVETAGMMDMDAEIDITIFSQCNNFVVLRLTNFNDQNCVKRLLPDNNSSLVDCLPTLSAGEALIVGDATTIPAIVKMELPNPKPKSDNVDFYSKWNNEWVDIDLADTIKRWRNEES
mgnify:CR=1 FL=1